MLFLEKLELCGLHVESQGHRIVDTNIRIKSQTVPETDKSQQLELNFCLSIW